MKATDKLAIGSKILASRLAGRPRPFFVQYSLLNGCNARCAYCDLPTHKERQFSFEQHAAILEEFASLGAVRVKFLGGEPLLRHDIEELIDHVNGLGMRSAMVTNGLLIPEKLDAIRKLSELVISIDGSEAAHDRQRGVGTWKKVMRGIEICAEEELDFFLSAVVTKESAGEIEWLLETASRLGVMVNFQIPQYNEAVYGSEARNWLPSPHHIRQIIARIIAAKAAGAPVLFTTRSYRRTLQWEDYAVERIEKPGEASPCAAGSYFVHMEPNGDLYPCVLHVGQFEPKNVVRDGVAAAWRHSNCHSCHACYNTWLNENRAIFSLHASVLGNFWQNYLRPRA
jgi:MoaA/NifB/PqqE/SkfB family radical SAM enzyme